MHVLIVDFKNILKNRNFEMYLENFDVFAACQKIENRDQELKEKDFPNPLIGMGTFVAIVLISFWCLRYVSLIMAPIIKCSYR